MAKITITPQVCKPSDPDQNGNRVAAAYSGNVELRLPNLIERWDLLDQAGAGSGEQASGLKIMRLAAIAAKSFVEKVDITRIEDDYKFTTYEDLLDDTELASVVSEIASQMVGKYQVGKTSTPS